MVGVGSGVGVGVGSDPALESALDPGLGPALGSGLCRVWIWFRIGTRFPVNCSQFRFTAAFFKVDGK